MRRWFVILLAVLLSVQFGWAAAATYCVHEAGSQDVRHFGHHTPAQSHLHEVKKSQKSVSGDQQHAVDLDHGHCHLIHVVIGNGDELSFEVADSAQPATGHKLLGNSHIPESLDRPNWSRA